ncbi:MAG TPA: nucleoside hydrolase [Solirubrobacter sp.]|nr:nucleoside hydrolase [Solirubrobacter sp.]
MPTPVIIDCDPGHDDAMAILLAVASPELELVAVTTVAGNQTLEKVTANALRVLDVAGADHVPVAAGADRALVHPARVAKDVHGETGLDGPDLPPPSRPPRPQHAVELIADRLRERPLTLVPIGPLTNVALLLATYPELAPRIERVVLMGGAIGLGNVTPSAEFNVWADPEAAARVLSAGLDVTLVGLDVTHRAMLSAERAEALRAGGRAGAVVADLHAFYRRFHERVYGHSDTPVHDALAVAHVIDPAILTTERLPVEIDVTQGPCRGRTVVDPLRRTGAEPNAHVAVDVDAPRFVDLLTTRIASLA